MSVGQGAAGQHKERRLSTLPFDSPLWVNTLLHSPKVRKSICSQHFRKFDTNKNGQLEEAELASLVSKVCETMKVTTPTKDDLHRSFQKFDKSKSDGLTEAEFARFFEHLLRTSLPLMEAQENTGEECVKQATDPAENAKQGPAPFVPSSAPDAKTVTVTNMGGSICWGPAAVDATQTVWELIEFVSSANGSVGVKLLFKDVILEEPSLPLASLTTERDLALSMYVLAPDALITQALQALQECPSDENMGTLPTPAGGRAFSGSDVVRANPNNLPEYRAWVDSGAQVVIKNLKQLASMGCKEPGAKDLLLKCLEIPPNDEVWDNGGWGSAIECFPDALTLAAAQALPAVVQTGDNDVMQVCLKWIRRVFCFHCYFSFDQGDHPCTTSNMETALSVLKSLPILFKGTKLQNVVKRKTHAWAANYMCYIEGLESRASADEVWAVREANEWKLNFMYKAIMSLTDAFHSSKKYNSPWWSERGYEFPLTGDGDDEDWMDEYMYKRTHDPQESAFRSH